MQPSLIVVRAEWDPEARVWVATSADIPGLVTEAEDQEQLMEKLHMLIPDLLEDDGFNPGGLPEIPVMVMSEQLAKVRVRA